MGRYLDIARRAIEQNGYDEQMQASVTPAIPACAISRRGSSCAPSQCPALPLGVRMVRYEPKPPPVAIDVCSVVTDVEKFIQAELRELDARLHRPVKIRGGWGVFSIIVRLRPVGIGLVLSGCTD